MVYVKVSNVRYSTGIAIQYHLICLYMYQYQYYCLVKKCMCLMTTDDPIANMFLVKSFTLGKGNMYLQ